jgi:hypothetical protein
MELHPVLDATFFGVAACLAGIGVAWFYGAYGAWMDDAFSNRRWIWFGLLLVFSFPASLISWLIVRAFTRRPETIR